MKIDVVPMTAAHISAVAQLEKLCFSQPWSEAGLTEELSNPNSHFLVAVKDGETAGYIGVQQVLDEGYVTNVAVSPSHRRQGIARALITEALQGLAQRSGAFLSLEVRASNAPAIALYTSCGFQSVGKRPGFYDKPKEDAILMTYYTERSGTLL